MIQMSSFDAGMKIMGISMVVLMLAFSMLFFAIWDIGNETQDRNDACEFEGYTYVNQGIWATSRDKPSTIDREGLTYLRCVTLIDNNGTQTMVDEWILYGD